MNVAILVTQKNFKDMAETATKILEKQDNVVNGALSIVYDKFIAQADIEEAFLPLSRRFKTSANTSVLVNESLSEDVKIALLFGVFTMQVYSRFPDGWLILDEKATPLADNIIEEVAKQHGALGGGMTGRGRVGEGSILPVGPVVIDLPQRLVKFLRYPVGESWRQRGQYQFSRSKFRQIDAKSYLWSVTDNHQEEKEVLDVIPEPEVERELPADFGEWSKKELHDYIEVASGVKAHHATGHSKLVKMAEGLKPQHA